jgi:hypothetical protein
MAAKPRLLLPVFFPLPLDARDWLRFLPPLRAFEPPRFDLGPAAEPRADCRERLRPPVLEREDDLAMV